MAELEKLVQTFGGYVILEAIQKKQVPDYSTYVGKWKLTTISQQMAEQDADILIIGNILKPRQLYRINEKLREASKKAWHIMKARDRVDLILKIFDKHANTTEAKLQIELAAIKHMWPRIFGMGMELSKQWWWIGVKWIGETNTEIMKRHLQDSRLMIQKKIDEYSSMRTAHRQRRKKNQVKSVWIVWYTNAWKSSLMNSLTNKEVLAENKLFATLWTTATKLFIQTDSVLGTGENVLLHDTIWFIRDLPPQLIQAFQSTLEDSIETDLLLHVVDISDPDHVQKIWIVDEILDTIWATQKRVLVYNKIDALSKEDVDAVILARIAYEIAYKKEQNISDTEYVYQWILCVSAQKQLWLDTIVAYIKKYFSID